MTWVNSVNWEKCAFYYITDKHCVLRLNLPSCAILQQRQYMISTIVVRNEVINNSLNVNWLTECHFNYKYEYKINNK